MKKFILPLMIAASLLLPFNASADQRGNNNRNRTERTTNSHRQSNSSSRPGNNSKPANNNNRPGNNNNRPGNNNNRPGNNNHRPGNNNNRPVTPPSKPGNPNHRPGNSVSKPGSPNHHPGGPAVNPGHHSPAWRPGSSALAPGHGARPHHPKLGYMVNHAIRGGRYDRVWMVAPGQYAVRFFRNGNYYMQYIWPEYGRYGDPFRIISGGPGRWYMYGNPNQIYYDDGNSLRISLNGSYMDPWTLIPSIELNINL